MLLTFYQCYLDVLGFATTSFFSPWISRHKVGTNRPDHQSLSSRMRPLLVNVASATELTVKLFRMAS
jgi:hypothetical protein